MKRILAGLVIACLLSLNAYGIVIPGSGVDVGENITVYDGIAGTAFAPGGHGVGDEDQEFDQSPSGDVTYDQKWDLEAFFLNSSAMRLGVVGGWDFSAGSLTTPHLNTYRFGDIFIDVDGALSVPGFDPGVNPATETYGYEYVLDINWVAGTFDVVSLTAGSMTWAVNNSSKQFANPWKYVGGTGTVLHSGLGFNTYSGLNDFAGLTGGAGSHNAAVFNLSGKVPTIRNVHLTLECGNEVMQGNHNSVSDGGATLSMLGAAILGLAALFRKITA